MGRPLKQRQRLFSGALAILDLPEQHKGLDCDSLTFHARDDWAEQLSGPGGLPLGEEALGLSDVPRCAVLHCADNIIISEPPCKTKQAVAQRRDQQKDNDYLRETWVISSFSPYVWRTRTHEADDTALYER